MLTATSSFSLLSEVFVIFVLESFAKLLDKVASIFFSFFSSSPPVSIPPKLINPIAIRPVIINVIPNGPSEKRGLQAGERIVFIENENVAGTGITNQDVIVIIFKTTGEGPDFKSSAELCMTMSKLIPGASCDIPSLQKEAEKAEATIKETQEESTHLKDSMYR